MELMIFLVMLGIFMASTFWFKLPVSISMVMAAVGGMLAGGEGFVLRHLVEGTFGYLDTVMVIATAMIFMKVVQESGGLDAINHVIIERFHRRPAVLLVFMMLVIMFPGMITGSSTASVLSAGALMAPILLMIGIPMVDTAAIIAIGGLLGMVAPPVNLPAMIIGGGIDMPYVGFEIPLLLMTIPLAVFSVLFLGLKHSRSIDYEQLKSKMNTEVREKYGVKVYLPILVVIVLMVAGKVFPAVVPNLGMPLIFVIGSLVGLFTGRRFSFIKTATEAVNDALPVMGILMGVGMFIQIMTLTGVRGFIVVNSISLPTVLLYIGIALTIPLFGAVSSFGASSVLGVPFLLALLGQNQIMTASALSLIASVGDLMPPTALAGIFAAQIVGVDNYFLVLKKCLIPAAIIIVTGILFIVFANPIASVIL